MGLCTVCSEACGTACALVLCDWRGDGLGGDSSQLEQTMAALVLDFMVADMACELLDWAFAFGTEG
jgi:hypothetical protein